MIFFDNKTNSKIDLNLLEDIANYLNIAKDIELLLVDDKSMQEINKEYRGVDKTTDVLSFPLEDIKYSPLGSIIISADRAKEAASALNHSLNEEMALLFIHGLLHLMGYDHENDSGQMRDKELEVIKKFNLPKSLIVRTKKERSC